MLDHQLDGIGKVVMDAAGLAAGESVLDVGCGCGSTTLSLARRVGEAGRAIGIDVSRPMLELARERARAEGVANATFVEADAQVHPFRPECDVLFSRFGVMFFDDPTAAFSNLHRALGREARLAFACWQALPKNPWMAMPMMAAMQHVQVDAPSSPDAPGAFAFADPTRVERILAEAGFRAISLKPLDVSIAIGGGMSLDETVEFLMEMGPLSRVLGSQPDDVRARVSGAVRAVVEENAGPDGVAMPGAIWLVTANA
jgi:SAM-dependent methyltransferase